MKKMRTITLLLAAAVAATALSGCTSKAARTREEYKKKGIAQLEVGDYFGAIESFQAALDTSVGTVRADEIDLCYYKAIALYKSGDTDGAFEVYNALIDFDDKNWEAYYLRGCLYLEEGQTDEALADYDVATDINEGDADLCINISENLSEAGLDDEGREYLNVVFTMEPSDAEDYYYLGEAYHLSGDDENAKTNLISAREQGYDEATMLLGTIYYNEGNTDAALEAFEAYMENHPDDAQAFLKMGEIAMESEDYEDALSYLTSAYDLGQEEYMAAIMKNLIAAYEYTGDFDSAYEMAGNFLQIYEDEDMEREYEFLESRMISAENAAEGQSSAENETEDDASAEDAGTTEDAGTADDAAAEETVE